MLAPLADHPFVGDVRVAGFMAGIELVTDKESRTPFSFEDQAGYLVTGIARELSLINRPIGNVVILMPPLASAENELFEMVEILKEALNRAEAELRKLATRGEAT